MPRRLQILIRRALVNSYLQSYKDVWPIDPESNIQPDGWKGWPEGKKFALILTHDVDTQEGHDQCLQLAEIEKKLGFRSSFNFVIGSYALSDKTIEILKSEGFEVGSHSVEHKNPFASKEIFRKKAIEINKWLKKWNAVGFRAPSMYHNLDMLHDLNVEYDASTFDTDPFEPQPDGAKTIFPFWVPGNSDQKGYVELPYTLPQDFLLFILLRRRNIDIWKKKLDWIAENNGMVLFISHPDYISFNEKTAYQKYPLKYYEEFLTYIKTKYEGQYWHALPRDVARFWAANYRSKTMLSNRTTNNTKRQKVWIDLENTPHIPFFKPIIQELDKRGYDCVLTARDAYQVIDMADRFGLKYKKIGHHYGKNKLLKLFGMVIRSSQLIPLMIKERPKLAIAHGSRTQLVASHMLGIPSLSLFDYEFTQSLVVIRPTYGMAPEVIPDNATSLAPGRFFKYPGIKEDVYVSSFVPDPSIKSELKIDDRKLVITIRPPATEAHYFRQASEDLFEASMKFLLQLDETQLVLLPRNKRQEEFIREIWPSAVASGKIIIPDHAVNGLDLMWYSDLVLSGGGTMNREAAALGVPVYSIFRGTIGAVDNYLAQKGRLVLLENADDLNTKLKLVKRDKNILPEKSEKKALDTIVNTIIKIVQKGSS